MAIDQQEILAAVAKRLGQVKPNTPWMTAGGLGTSIDHQEQDVREALTSYARSEAYGEYPIRYSRFPSKNNLDLLWGHTDFVGCLPRQEPLDKNESELFCSGGSLDGSQLFLSHSHHDTRRALELRKALSAQGLNLWLAETNILRGQAIVDEIRFAFQGCDALLLDVTIASIASLWVQKEFLTFPGRKLVLVDGGCDALLDAFEGDLNNPPAPPEVDPNEINPQTIVYPEFIKCVTEFLADDATPFFAHPATSRKLCGKPLHGLDEILAFLPSVQRQ